MALRSPPSRARVNRRGVRFRGHPAVSHHHALHGACGNLSRVLHTTGVTDRSRACSGHTAASGVQLATIERIPAENVVLAEIKARNMGTSSVDLLRMFKVRCH